MCGTCGTKSPESHELIFGAREAADEILSQLLHIPIAKAMSLSTQAGFDRAVAGLARSLRLKTADSETDAVRAAIQTLDVDWSNTTKTQRASLIDQAMKAAGQKVAGVPKKLEAVFKVSANDVIHSTRNAARNTERLRIGADLNALDKRIIQYLSTSQSGFVSDEYGRRNEAFGKQAHIIVAEGLESGLGRHDIAQNLERAAKDIIPGRNSFYWEVVAGSFVSQGRSFSQLSSYAEAGIERYVIEAVLDENTTEICRFLHGKSFTVGSGLHTFDRLESEPDRIKEIRPWVRESLDSETGRKTLFVERGEQRLPITEVTRSGMGIRDDRGEFNSNPSERDLQELGIGFPPYHGLCRSTLVPILYKSPSAYVPTFDSFLCLFGGTAPWPKTKIDQRRRSPSKKRSRFWTGS
jgi:hypothetical protein